MNAIRSLPLINRNPSRTATPGPQSQASGAAIQPPLGPPVGPDQRNKRPLSQVVAPAPVPGFPTQRSQSAGRKGGSPPASRAETPRQAATPLPVNGADAPQQTGGHVDAIGARFSDVVIRACAGVDPKNKKGFRTGAGWTVGESIAHELPAPPADTYLLRAVLRTAVRALSIYVSRLEALLLPALSDPQFASALNLAPTTQHQSPLNATQAFAVTVAHAAWETCERLEQMVDSGKYPRFVEDALRPTMDKFDTVVGRVVRPMLRVLKADLEGCLVKAAVQKTQAVSANGVPLVREKSNPGTTRLTKELSGSGHARSNTVPPCLQQFASRVDGARKVFELVCAPCGHDGEGWIAKIVVAVIWKGMRLITENDSFQPLNQPPSPGTVHKALSGLGKEATPTVVASTALPKLPTLPSLAILTPRATQSRPASPPRATGPRVDAATQALMAFEGLIKRLVVGLVQPPTAPPSAADSDDQEQEYIAREALHEAREALESAIVASQAISGTDGAKRILESLRRLRDDIDDETDEKLDDALEDLPSVSLFGMILRRANFALSTLPASLSLRLREPAEVLGWAAAEYERQILSGFGPAEESGPRIARALKPEIENMLAILQAIPVDERADQEVLEGAATWVKALGVSLDARTGVKVARAT